MHHALSRPELLNAGACAHTHSLKHHYIHLHACNLTFKHRTIQTPLIITGKVRDEKVTEAGEELEKL